MKHLQRKMLISASTFEEFHQNLRTKFGLTDQEAVVVETDQGFEVIK